MPQTKIVFFDIDGTLIDMQAKKITPKMLETLHRLQDRGIKICIATGRSPMVLPKIDGVAFDAYLTFNGSLCYDRKGVIFSNPIPHKDVVRFIQNAAALGRPVCVSTRDRLAANGTDTDLTDYFFIANEPVPVADDFDAVCAEDIYQLMLGCRPKDYPALLDGAPGAKIAAWWDRAVDVIPAGGGNNDREMLQAVGTGVAMENGSPELKALADEICGPVYEDGIYHYCADKGLI